MALAVRPPVPPMLARLAREVPRDGFLYEPKWDGFRALAFRDGREIDIRSRHGRPLARYFPELVEALVAAREESFVLDGEIVLLQPDRSDFPALMARLHPTASRVERLRHETPASFVAFDVVAVADDVRGQPFATRRSLLESLLAAESGPLSVTPITDDAEIASAWLDRFEGIVAKHRDLVYQPGVRAMVKVKTERTADCVVAGFRWMADRPLLGSLLLGLHDEAGGLRHVGVVTSFTQARRQEVLDELAPLVTEIEGHPWEHGFGLDPSPLGRLLGAAGRWAPGEMARDWIPVRPERVCEVAYDQIDGYRFRHPARFRRWRPDREPRSCALDQLEPAPSQPRELLDAG
ncbi:MAG TPA: ATP-dependent DNA ligase [Gaiellaceae bacterium]|nr:ATP-dependent DNA ligase [Gaiellaceae bacterium]